MVITPYIKDDTLYLYKTVLINDNNSKLNCKGKTKELFDNAKKISEKGFKSSIFGVFLEMQEGEMLQKKSLIDEYMNYLEQFSYSLVEMIPLDTINRVIESFNNASLREVVNIVGYLKTAQTSTSAIDEFNKISVKLHKQKIINVGEEPNGAISKIKHVD